MDLLRAVLKMKFSTCSSDIFRFILKNTINVLKINAFISYKIIQNTLGNLKNTLKTINNSKRSPPLNVVNGYINVLLFSYLRLFECENRLEEIIIIQELYDR